MDRIVLFILIAIFPCLSFAESDETLLTKVKRHAFPLFAGQGVEASRQPRSCIGFDVALGPRSDLAVFASAGHCQSARFTRDRHGHDRDTVLIGRVHDGVAYDFLYAQRAVCPGDSPTAPSVVPLRVGERYFSLGQVRAIDAIANPTLSPLVSDDFDKLGLVEMSLEAYDETGGHFLERCPIGGCVFRMTPGVSGAPIVDRHGNIAAIYVGYEGLSLSALRGVSLEHVFPMARAAALHMESGIPLDRWCLSTEGVRR